MTCIISKKIDVQSIEQFDEAINGKYNFDKDIGIAQYEPINLTSIYECLTVKIGYYWICIYKIKEYDVPDN